MINVIVVFSLCLYFSLKLFNNHYLIKSERDILIMKEIDLRGNAENWVDRLVFIANIFVCFSLYLNWDSVWLKIWYLRVCNHHLQKIESTFLRSSCLIYRSISMVMTYDRADLMLFLEACFSFDQTPRRIMESSVTVRWY